MSPIALLFVNLLINPKNIESIGNVLGVGGTATVYEVVFKENVKVALKMYFLDAPNLRKSIRLLRNETLKLVNLKHPNIIACNGL